MDLRQRNIGISDNVTGTVYQLQLIDPTSATPSAVVLSATTGPASTQNDGAASKGESADLGITKSGPTEWDPNDALTYQLTVHNYGPGDSPGYIVRDVLPSTFLNPATSTPGCQITVEDSDNVVVCAGGELAAGSDGPVISVTGTTPATAGTDCVSGAISNTAQVIGNEPDPTLDNNERRTTACPAGHPEPSFTVSKTADVAAPAFVRPGESVTYTVTVHNTGTVACTDADPASFRDDLGNVLDDATLDPASLTGGATITNGSVTWSGPLAVGASATITYKVVVKDPDTGDHVLTNALVAGPTGGCAPGAACEVTTPIAGFTVAKSVSESQAAPGDKVTYTITVTNNGQVNFGGTTAPATGPAQFSDSLAQVLPYATYDNDATGGAMFVGGVLSWTVDLPIGDTATYTYSVTVHNPVNGPATLTNAVAPAGPGRCVTPAACSTDTPVSGYTIAKSASATHANPGDTVRYTVVVTNTGAAPYTDATPATFSDDLSDVLNNARYNGDATQGATLSGTTLSWSGPLAVGASVTVTYSVTVNDSAAADTSLRNAARADRPDGGCAAGNTCSTTTTIQTPTPPAPPKPPEPVPPAPPMPPAPPTHPAPHPQLPRTGTDLPGMAASAVAATLLGVGLLRRSRRGVAGLGLWRRA